MRNTLRKGYRRIPGASNYAINRSGLLYRIDDNTDLSPYTANSHWSGNIKLVDNAGTRRHYNIAQLVGMTFRIRREETLRATVRSVRDMV